MDSGKHCTGERQSDHSPFPDFFTRPHRHHTLTMQQVRHQSLSILSYTYGHPPPMCPITGRGWHCPRALEIAVEAYGRA